jgi:hypothetical protein
VKRVTITVDSDVDIKFRKKASQKYQFEKGWYSKAVVDAMDSWATENSNDSADVNSLMNSINPEYWEILKLELNIEENDPFENMEDFINYINNESSYDLKIDREGNNIMVELKNGAISPEDLEKNLKTMMILHLIIKIILSSMEKTTKDKYVVSGIGTIPPVYIKKVK